MTTNVFDISAGILASDSRWSGGDENYLFYVDNVEYDKMVFDSRLAILFAGNLEYIELWKKWFRGGRYAPAPGVHKDFSMCIIDMATGQLRKDHGIKIMSPCNGARFAGTGSPHALNCWTQNQSAQKSVETACDYDLMSGGKVCHLNIATQENNVSNAASAAELLDAFLPRGNMIMFNGNQQMVPTPIAEAIKDPAANDAFNKMMAGGVSSVCAPFIGMGTPWTENETEELYAILNEYPPEPQ